jgi:hypothetical protein
MTQQEMEELVEQGERVYQERLKDQLERSHLDWFCTIEPVSGRYFLGETLSDAANAAQAAMPGEKTHTVRIGHRVAVELGASIL